MRKEIIVFLAYLIFSQEIYAQTWKQIGSDIDGEYALDRFGQSVSISSDGRTMAIGANDNSGVPNFRYAGHVKVYENVKGTWQQIGSDIEGEAERDYSGYSVSLSGDGSTVAIGAPGNAGSGDLSGHVRVYENVNGTWKQIGSDIDGEAKGDQSGQSLSLSRDGSTVAIGAPRNDDNGLGSGHVRVYENVNGTWKKIGSDIDGEATGDFFGYSVSLDRYGTTVAIGAPYNDVNGNAGHVRVYENVNGTWKQIGSDIDGERFNDEFGYSLSLSIDGNVLAVGAPQSDFNGFSSGHVSVYENVNGTWKKIGSDIKGKAAYHESGFSVSLSGDGTTVAIGTDDNNYVSVYENVNGKWKQIGSDIDGEATGDRFGYSVSLDSNGTTVVIGAPYNGSGTQFLEREIGHVRVYTTKTCTTDYSTHKVTSCGNYTWTNGITYTEDNNTATDTFVNNTGCDSIVTLNLNVIITSPLITQQPEDANHIEGETAKFSVKSDNYPEATYQWQLYKGSFYLNLLNDERFSGVSTNTLSISDVLRTQNSMIFRCVISEQNCLDTTNEATLYVTKNVSTKNLLNGNSVDVYPIPFNNELDIRISSLLVGSTYRLFDSRGKIVKSGILSKEINRISFIKISEGIYYLDVDKINTPVKVIK